MEYLLSIALWMPILAGILAYFVGKANKELSRYIAIAVTVADLLISLFLWVSFDVSNASTFQFTENYPWIPTIGVTYYLGIDGLGLALLTLTTLLTAMAAIASKSIKERVNLYYAMLLFLETGIIGVFISLDLFLFYVFWEIVLVPMYFLIAIWGGPRRKYAAIKFFLYTHLGSVIMLISFFAAYWVYYQSTGILTFNMLYLTGYSAPAGHTPTSVGAFLPLTMQIIFFAAIFFGFAVKVPIVPFHTWLPDAHVEAPTPISVILAGLLLKMGGYGLIRIAYPLLPQAAEATAYYVAWIGIVSIFYASFAAMSQVDLKRLIAYSSIGHMGIVVLGFATLSVVGIAGAIFMMFSHGLINGLMFLMSGVYKERFHTRDIPKIGGYTTKLPIASFMLVFGAFASAGLPGLSGFVAEFLVILGAFKTWELNIAIVVLGVVITAGYLLWMVQRVIFGPQKDDKPDLKDLALWEFVPLFVLMVVIILLGVYPDILLRIIDAPTLSYQQMITGG